MSKDFAEEYKALANEELPDLWNRIEAGLTPKTTALTGESLQESSQEPSRVSLQEASKEPEKRKVVSFLYRYRTVVAAALCVIVILPAVILLRGGNSKSSTMESASAADDAEASAEEPVEESAADTAAEIFPAEADEALDDALAEEAGTGSASQDSGRDGADLYADSAKPEDLSLENGAEKKMEQQENRNSSTAMSDEAADSAEEEKVVQTQGVEESLDSTKSREEKIFERVTVEAGEATGETAKADKNFLYEITMKVIEDPSGELEKGAEIKVWISYFSSVAYTQGQEYVLDLSYQPDRECPYQVEKTYFS